MADKAKAVRQDRRETSPDPETTWNATEEAKAAWDEKHGEGIRRANEEAAEK